MRRVSLIVLMLGALAAVPACARVARSMVNSWSCAPLEVPSDRLTGIMADAVVAMPDEPHGRRVRAMAGVPTQRDSIKARIQPVYDDATCRNAGRTARVWKFADTYEVLKLGRTLWVRGTSWSYTNVLDENLTLITSIADQD
jgi:hypothetical protein